MSKVLAKTTGAFLLMNEGDEIPFNRPAVTEDSSFLNQRLNLKQVKSFGPVKADAKDSDFVKFWNASKDDKGVPDEKLAVESFMAKFAEDAADEPEETDDEKKARLKKEDDQKKADQEKADKEKKAAEELAKKNGNGTGAVNSGAMGSTAAK